jgi:hypothetical protein
MRAAALAVLSSLVAAAAFAQDGRSGDYTGRSGDYTGRHGQGHAENHDWYERLKRPDTGASCCNGTTATAEGDCRPTRAYQGDDGAWRALMNGRWVPVPPKVVLQTLSPDGASHICANKTGTIFCFIGGSPRS